MDMGMPGYFLIVTITALAITLLFARLRRQSVEDQPTAWDDDRTLRRLDAIAAHENDVINRDETPKSE